MYFRSESSTGFKLPPYPYDLLNGIKASARTLFDEVVDLSIGTPVDPPPLFVPSALATSGKERSYPPSFGTLQLRSSASAWMKRTFGVEIDPSSIGATLGSKEFIVSLPRYLRLINPNKNTVLFPQISYPSYEMGALLAGCVPFKVPQDESGLLLLDSLPESVVEDSALLWLNLPSNPTGKNAGMREALAWASKHGVIVASDECYADFTWDGRAKSALEFGTRAVLAVHSLSKRSNMAGLRVGTYSGDPELVEYISEVRKHSGMMVPGPIQDAAAGALMDDGHVMTQRSRYLERLQIMSEALGRIGLEAPLPEGGFYLWTKAPAGAFVSGFDFANWLAKAGGFVSSPGELYGADGVCVRIAMVATTETIKVLAHRVQDVRI
jgi:aspartate/methionine/tyrosine aminotransferase